MAKHGEGLGYEIVKAVLSGKIIEPITFQKVKDFCERSGFTASENHMKVILSNATENTHSPTYKVFFERVGKGEYRILSKYRRDQKYFWLNVDSASYEWSFSDPKVGRSQTYSNLNPNGNKRENESCFKLIQIGDKALAYEIGITKAITTICQVVDKHEDNGEIFIEFQKISDYDIFLDLVFIKTNKELLDCNVLTNHRGTLFELEKKHFDVIRKMLEDLNGFDSYYHDLNLQVKRSLAGGSREREERLKQRSTVIPDSYETKTRMFRRSPDVIAEVLVRANGVCEKCEKPAPFNRASDGTPYLEVHHKKRLADGGEDTVDNAIAVCPNCHRELHFG